MHRSKTYALILSIFLAVSALSAPAATKSPPAPEVLRVWPGPAPGTESWSAPEEEADVTLPGVGKIHVITNVTVPTLTVVRPAQANGTAMVVLPGGSFRALAWDVDGLETAQWLASTGITAFVLKYRVRPPQEGETFGRTLQDFATATRTRRAIAVADAKAGDPFGPVACTAIWDRPKARRRHRLLGRRDGKCRRGARQA